MSVKIRQEINIDDIPNNGSFGVIQLDTTKYVNPTYYFEVVTSSSGSGTDSYTLRRKGTTTDDATVSFASADSGRKRSTAFTPPAGQTEYIKFLGTANGHTFRSARIIIIDNPTTLTTTETQIEIGMNQSGLTSTAATKVVPDTTLTKYWKYTAADWDGTKTFYAEVTYLMASSKSSGTFVLQEDNGSFASWVDKVTIVSAGVASAATRARSAAFTPTDGRNYRIAYLVASSKSAASIFNAKIIVDQTAQADLIQTSSSNSGYVVQGGTAGSSQTGQAAGQSFTAGSSYSLAGISLQVLLNGAPTDNLIATIYTGSINGTLIGTSDAVAGTKMGTAPGATPNVIIPFSTPVSLTSGVKYYVEFNRSGVRDITNYYQLSAGNGSLYANGGAYTLANTVWGAESATDDLDMLTLSSTALTSLEPQYLLLNTADSNATGVQSYQTLWDSTEWSGVTNIYTHAMDSDNASNSAKLRDITAGADITSTVTGANQQISSAITMPTTGHEIDTWILNTTGTVAAGRILVASTVSAGSVITKTQPAIARVANTVTKTQPAQAAIQGTATKTQGAIARIVATGTKTQPATARVARNIAKTQGAIARIAQSITKTQPAKAAIQGVVTKTQPAIGRIVAALTKTQPAVARVANVVAKTQGAIARIQSPLTKTQGAAARIVATLTKTQPAIARIQQLGTKTQPAIARIAAIITKTQPAISRIATNRTKTQPATANISTQSTVTKTQPAIARVANTRTATQPAVARVSNILTKTQGAIAHITAKVTKTQPAVAKIASTVTKTQPGVARIANNPTKTQPSVARISNILAKVQPGVARIASTLTKTQPAIARIATARVKTQPAIGRIAQGISKTQTSVARIATNKTKVQPAIGRIANALAKTQPAIARISQTYNRTQAAVGRIAVVFTKTQPAQARIAQNYAKTQAAIGRIAATGTKTQPASSRIANALSKIQTSIAYVVHVATKTQPATAHIATIPAKTQPAVARLANCHSYSQPATAYVLTFGSIDHTHIRLQMQQPTGIITATDNTQPPVQLQQPTGTLQMQDGTITIGLEE